MKDFSIPPSPPQPTLTSADAVHATGDMVWWTGREQSLCQLNIGTCSGGSCAVAYFVGSSFSWFDFQALDMRYHPGLRKAVTVSALYPYTTVDELAASSEPLGKRATWQRVDLIEDEIKMPNISREATAPRRPRGFGYEDVAKLPTCSSTSEAQSLRNIGAAVETRVSVRGILTLMGWACTLVGCAGGGHCCNDCWAEWVLENAAPKIRVLGLLQNMEPLGQVGANECHLPAKLPRVEVIASGVLVSNGHDRYSLDEFNLCAVRPGAPINGH